LIGLNVEELADLSESQLRLDGMLIELGDDGMTLSQLDGFLCGVATSPDPIPQDEWLPLVWGGEDFDVPAVDQAELIALVTARYDEINAELTEAHYEPLYEVDDDDETDVLWEIWIMGFEAAMGLRMASWEKLLNSRQESQAQEAAFAIVSLLGATEPDMDEKQRNDPEFAGFIRDAPQIIPEIVATLYRAHRLTMPQSPIRSTAVGRNDPCPCGSGLKYKRCHGAS
jgi:uncharacterized protein